MLRGRGELRTDGCLFSRPVPVPAKIKIIQLITAGGITSGGFKQFLWKELLLLLAKRLAKRDRFPASAWYQS